MPEHVYRKWNPPCETRLPDIHGWLQDIHSTREFLERLDHVLSAEVDDPIVLDALSTAALVRYSRCFTTGSRERLQLGQLDSASEAEIALHDRLRAIRDWHVAHPINLQEVHAFYVIVDADQNATTGALGFSSFSSGDLALRPDEVEAAIRLCDRWIKCLTEEFVNEQMKLLPLANRLSRDELLNLPADEPQPNPNLRARRRQKRQ
jgi:hypothetical protein